MSELQALLASWLTELAAVLPFGFAFGVGMVAAVNPCGFAMLPAYLSLYLGAHEEGFGFDVDDLLRLDTQELRQCHTSWAKAGPNDWPTAATRAPCA